MKSVVLLVLMLSMTACTGPKGDTGSAGTPGVTGPTGSTGSSGTNGVDGYSTLITQTDADTDVCPNGGYVLSIGLDLNRDATLDPDEVTTIAPICNGSNGADGQQGVAGNDGATGPQGDPGTNGNDGATGPQGNAGTNGNDGTNATPVSIVQLCPGTSTYGTFIEVGFCIGGDLYGTYSANGGFSTLIAPGSYSSSAINSSCSLTVHPNCVVTH
jgi:hypothetical protein